MNAMSDLKVLLAEIRKTREVLHRIDLFHADYCAKMSAGAERSTENRDLDRFIEFLQRLSAESEGK
jgi:hypothetical protein